MKVSYHPSKFGGHSHSCGRNIMLLVYHVISQDHVMKRLYHFICESSFELVTTLPILVAKDTVIVEV